MTDTTRTIALGPPLESYWIKIETDVKMRLFEELRVRLLEALKNPGREEVNACLATVAPMIVEHNLLDVETGKPLTFDYGEMTGSQVLAVLRAISERFRSGGESADPLPSRKTKSAISPGGSSPASPSPSTSPSSPSPSS